MARDPGSVWAPLPEAGAPDGYVKTQFIVHSTGDNATAEAIRRYFEGSTQNESTFIVGWGPHQPTLQIMDSTDRADANVSANERAIAVEVVGDGSGGYNAWQRSEIIRIGIWARQEHRGILPRIVPVHDAPGYGWHVMFGAPSPWTGVAKICPGPIRIQELKNDIFPAIFAGTYEEGNMAGDAYNRYEVVAPLTEITTLGRSAVAALGREEIRSERILAALEAKPVDADELAKKIADIIGTEALTAALESRFDLTSDQVRDILKDIVADIRVSIA